MGSFGFGAERSAELIGLNSKMSELAALTARLQLRRYGGILERAEGVANAYRHSLGDVFELQQPCGVRQARSFQSILLPRELAVRRRSIVDAMGALGVGVGCYFSPHLAQQPLFQTTAASAPLPVTEDVASRILSLPLRGSMTLSDVHRVVLVLQHVTGLDLAVSAPAGLSLPFAVPSVSEVSEAKEQTRAA